MRHALLLVALLLAAGQAPAGESLGRLFYTPEQRAQLDKLRSQKTIAQPVPEQAEPAPVPEVITFGGIVRRSDGKSTVWINNQAVSDGKAADRLPISSRVRSDDSISLQLPQADRSIELKVGQSVEIVSGSIAEPYARSRATAKPRSKAAEDVDRHAPSLESASVRPPRMRKGEDEDDPDRRNGSPD